MHVEQPQMGVAERDHTERQVAISLDIHPLVPAYLLTDIATWSHEFTEMTMMRIFDNLVPDPMTGFDIILLEGGQYWLYYTTMPHILASLSGFSLFDHREIFEDDFWQMLQKSIPPKEYKKRLEANMQRWGWDWVP